MTTKSNISETERNAIRDTNTAAALRIIEGKYSDAAKDRAVEIAVDRITKEVPVKKEKEG